MAIFWVLAGFAAGLQQVFEKHRRADSLIFAAQHALVTIAQPFVTLSRRKAL
jgi:hypothetical protein